MYCMATSIAWSTDLMHYRNERAGVFVTVNETDGKGRQAHNVARVRAVFADLDGAPLAPVLEAGLEPHIVCESSPGRYHAYWLCDDCSLDQFEHVQRALAQRFGGDPSVHDRSRVMRLPGFRHFKGDAQTCKLLDGIGTTAPAYSLAELVSALNLDLDGRGQFARVEKPVGATARSHPAVGTRTCSRWADQWHDGAPLRPCARRLVAENTARCDPPLAEADIDYLAERVFTAKDSEGWEAPVDFAKMKDAGVWRTADAVPREWPDPQPLPLGLPPVAPFEFRLLPESLRRWGEDIVDGCAARLTTSASRSWRPSPPSSAARSPSARRQHDDWTVIPNLWAFLIGRPGVLKSPAMEESLKPIKRLIAKAIDEHKGLAVHAQDGGDRHEDEERRDQQGRSEDTAQESDGNRHGRSRR